MPSAPGWTITPMTEKFEQDPEAMKRALQTMALRKFAKPQDIANTVVFLIGDNSGHVSGQIVTVAGGMEGRVLYSPDEIDI